MSPQEIERLCMGLALGLPLASLVLGSVILGPVWLGLRAAKRKGVSRHWMWLSLVFPPIGAWLAWLAIAWQVRSTACAKCGQAIPAGVDSCPHCHTPTAYTHTANQWKSRTRWALWTGNIACPGCHTFVPPNTDTCPHCGVALPRIKCPVCGQHDTQLVHRPKFLRVTAVALVFLSCVFLGIAQNTRHDHMALSGPLFVIGIYLAIAGLVILPLLLHSPWSRRLFCRPCYYSHYKFHRLAPRNIEWYQPAPDEHESSIDAIEPEACRAPSTEYRVLSTEY